jgi:sirohydrochlorin cobaltochelatase
MSQAFDGVVLLAHGARDARWMIPFHKMRSDLAAKLAPAKVAVAFLDFAPPQFSAAVANLHAAGARRVLVAPVFLSGGGHVAKDVPELVEPERARYADMTFVVSGAIGEEPEVTTALSDAVFRLARG